MRRLVGLAVVALVVAGTTPARADDSRVTIHFEDNAFKGRVVSSSRDCEHPRQVALMRKQDGADYELTSTVTDVDGKWVVFADPGTKGSFYAKIFDGGGCAGDRSRTIDV
jgi:hypothetical protein